MELVDPALGLTTDQVETRIAAGQNNVVPGGSGRSLAAIVRANVFTRFNALLGSMFVIMLIVGPIQDALFGFVIVVNTGVGIVQEWRAKRTLDRLAVVGEARPRVRRDGTERELPPAGLVRDDIVLLGSGDKIPVDGQVVSATELEVDESLLTGEADPVHKKPGDEVLSGSFVVAGSGAFQATRVGAEAYAAKLAAEASKFTLVRSELRDGVNRILGYVMWLMIPVGALQIATQLHPSNGIRHGVSRVVAGLVPMVPEGLVLLTSVAFAAGVVRLGRRACLVQELPAIEGLARVDTVCLDKTGTLTEGRMRLVELRQLGTATRHDDPSQSEAGRGEAAAALGALCATEERPNATLRALADVFPAPADGWTPRSVVPFSSARKWSGADFGPRGSWLLGAPDVLLPAGDPARMDAERTGARGLRVLLLARLDGPLDAAAEHGELTGLTPVALAVLEQALRPDAKDTLDYFARQSVTAKVISGDNAVSVGAVAAAVDVPGADDPVDARTLPTQQGALADVVTTHSVFGRVTPAQKRAMVGALQSRGHVVAMTGDGVNDVLALKDADIGVAMGSGSGATRAVAQIVLLDDRFATLPVVVAEGRRVIGNIERVANLFLVKTVYSLLLVVLIGLSGLAFPFLPRHVTLIGSLTIGIPAFFLALAPNNERARQGFVPRVLWFAVPAGLAAAGATFAAYYLARADGKTSLDTDQTTATITLFTFGLFVLLLVARPWTWWRIGLVAAMAGCFLLVLAVPFGRRFFDLHPRDPGHILIGLAIAAGAALLLAVFRRLPISLTRDAAQPTAM
jgi:cation-transporting ATPase E